MPRFRLVRAATLAWTVTVAAVAGVLLRPNHTAQPRQHQGQAQPDNSAGAHVAAHVDTVDATESRAAGPSQPDADTSQGLDLGSVPVFLSLAALLIYSFDYWLTLSFYEHFGVTPEDVGWSYIRATARTAAIVLVGSLVYALALVALVGLGGVLRWLSARTKLTERLALWLSKGSYFLAKAVALAVLTVACLHIYERLQDSVMQTATGIQKVTDDVIPAPVARVVGIDVPLGIARWTQPSTSGPATTQTSLVYLLGQANGTTIVFDSCDRRVIRVPSGSFVLEQVDKLDAHKAPAPDASAPSVAETLAEACRKAGRPIRTGSVSS